MQLPYEIQLGWRYTRAGKSSGRNGFISFISMISMLGIALGVAALIIVLSVVNGFQKEVRDRMLSVVSHIEIYNADGSALPDVARTILEAKSNSAVVGAAPFIAAQSLLARGDSMTGAMVRGIDPALEGQVSDLLGSMRKGSLEQLTEGSFGVVLGSTLADSLGVNVGDQVTMIAPGGQMTPAGVVPRLKQLTVLGTFESGHYQYDASLALLNVNDAAKIFRLTGPAGVRLKLQDLHAAREVAYALSGKLTGDLVVKDWTRENKEWFDAVQIEKRMLGLILILIVAVAAFNLVTTLVMTVTDKRADIAILRTLGASPRGIMKIFMVQGSVVGVVGTVAGVLFGLLIAFNVDVIVPAMEQLFRTQFLPAQVYLISRMPSDPQASDIVPIVVISLLLSFLATIYPSWRASRVNPAAALRYE